ncbi:MAG: hypothetical protein JWN41_189 [Thermoleophilia bacterium]|nr:hypothetical protein [Thermoleophilia bacterium]
MPDDDLNELRGSGRAGVLHVCAVPIGNLDDASVRVRRVLAQVDIIACEDTRTTRRLLGLLGVATEARLLAHHAHNERAGAAGIIALLAEGQNVALVSDAGTPAVNDPGVAVVAAAHSAGIEVVAVPGPSAVSAAVSIAGFAGAGYRFVGFMPRAAGELRTLLTENVASVVVAFEGPSRIVRTMAIIAELQPEREVAVCRELTKRHENVLRGRAGAIAEAVAGGELRGEFVVVLAPLATVVDDTPDEAVAFALELESEGVRLKRACSIAAERIGGSSRALYEAVRAARDSDVDEK